MGLGKLGQALTAREVFELLRDDLVLVEKEIHRESVASVDAITAIGQYLQEAGGKRLRPSLLLLSSKLIGDGTARAIRTWPSVPNPSRSQPHHAVASRAGAAAPPVATEFGTQLTSRMTRAIGMP